MTYYHRCTHIYIYIYSMLIFPRRRPRCQCFNE